MIVAIIGIDGSGKSTQAAMLTERLQRDNKRVRGIRPVYVLLEALRLCKGEKSVPLSPRRARTSGGKGWPGRSFVMGLLGYLYAWASWLYVKLFLERGGIVICDRYFYQFFYDIAGNCGGLLSRWFPTPDVTFCLTSRVEDLYQRMEDPVDKGVVEDYYGAVTALLQRVSAEKGFVCLDASQTREETHAAIYRRVTQYMES